MRTEKLKVAILGSTGSVGSQAVDVVREMQCETVLLTASSNIASLEEQARQLDVKRVGITDPSKYAEIKQRLADRPTLFFTGEEEICRAIESCGADVIIHAVSGLAGLSYAFAAAKTGARLAMANKEVIISSGELLFQALSASGGILIPVDSEHCAVFQCLTTIPGFDRSGTCVAADHVRRILLTASGGPFYGKKKEEFHDVSPEEALRHPVWKMGAQITVNSATMMNKGFEVIEASRLFGIPSDRIEVLIHRQGVVHSLVEFTDRMVMAQLGLPDMRSCIRYAVSYPERAEATGRSLDLTETAPLTFAKPDFVNFPLLGAAYDALRVGGTAPTALIAANEEAVGAFLRNAIPFGVISEIVAEVMERHASLPVLSVSSVIEAERLARTAARLLISNS